MSKDIGSPAHTSVENAMDDLAGTAPRLGRSVREISRWSHNTKCGTNNAMFAARLDGDRLLLQTTYEPEFGQSVFAIARGARAESRARANSYGETFSLLREHFGYGVTEVVARDLRHGFQKNNVGLGQRYRETRKALKQILQGEKDAPNVIDGAVLRAN